MPQPLYGDDVVYQDGTEASLEQEVLDLVTFLTWTAMPELESRKSAGVKVIFFSYYDILLISVLQKDMEQIKELKTKSSF